MSIAHHLDDATLMSLAAGTLTPALAVVAADHAAGRGTPAAHRATIVR